MRQIVFDTETTGFKANAGDRLVEIGAIEMVRGAITGANFHVYVNPERDMPVDAYNVHKLSEEFLSDKPVFADPSIGQAFLTFVEGAELIAHNASFDIGFMQAELKRAGLPELTNKVTDTLQIARKKFPGSPASLDALCSRFGIDTAERERHGHGALLDSRLLAEVYIELTGGAQGGLQFSADTETSGGRIVRPPTLQRPAPLSSRISDAEKAAHIAFIAEMDTPVWQSN